MTAELIMLDIYASNAVFHVSGHKHFYQPLLWVKHLDAVAACNRFVDINGENGGTAK